MTSLRTLQEQFQAYLLGENAAIEAHINGKDTRTTRKRLSVYTDAYYLRLIDILKLIFPAIFYYLGEEEFEEVTQDYLEQYPASGPFVRDIGEHFTQYLNDHPVPNKLFLSEMAAFELAWSKTAVIANAPVVSQQDLLAIPEENWPAACFILHPTVQVFSFAWNIPELWRCALWEQAKNVQPEQLALPLHWIIWRKDLSNYYIQCSREEAVILKNMADHYTFDELCQSLLSQMSEEKIAEYLVQRILRWLNDGMLSQIKLDNKSE